MKPLFLAPMAGVTDKPFRQMVRRFGNQVLYTEMIGVESLARNHPATRKMMDIRDEKNIIVQLVGINKQALVYAAEMAQDMGAVGVDINMGCPVRKLISNGSGAALMKNPDLAAELVDTVRSKIKIPLSVKMRIGWDQGHINAISFAKRLTEAGANSLTIHARTKEQGFSGHPDWDTVRAVRESVSVPITANGDITNRTEALNVINLTGADSLMIGRGALGHPWILSEIETGIKPNLPLADLIKDHLHLMINYYGPHGVFVARKHLAWYAKGQKNVAQFCQSVYAETDIQKVEKTIDMFFKEVK